MSLRGGRFLHRLDGHDPRPGARSHSWPGSMPRAIRALVAMLFIVGRFVRGKGQAVEENGHAKNESDGHGGHVQIHALASFRSKHTRTGPREVRVSWPLLAQAPRCENRTLERPKTSEGATSSPSIRTYIPAALCNHWRFSILPLVIKYDQARAQASLRGMANFWYHSGTSALVSRLTPSGIKWVPHVDQDKN